MEEHGDWREEAVATYRSARMVVDAIPEDRRSKVEMSVTDINEALLDLKEAVGADDEPRARWHRAEVVALMTEIVKLLD